MINKIAKNRLIQNIISKTVTNHNFKYFINSKLPVLETIVATTSYSVAIVQNKKIERERKPAMHWQNIISGVVGIFVSSKINKIIQKSQNRICKELENSNIYKVNNVINGVRVAVPLIIFSTLLRFIVPVLATPISTFLVKNNNKKKQAH